MEMSYSIHFKICVMINIYYFRYVDRIGPMGRQILLLLHNEPSSISS